MLRITELRALQQQVTVHVVLSDHSCTTARRTGFVHEAVRNDLPSLADSKVYVAGPPPMVSSVARLAGELGASDFDIHSDPFVAAPLAHANSFTQAALGLWARYGRGSRTRQERAGREGADRVA